MKIPPWIWFAEIMESVIRRKGFTHWKPSGEVGMIHAGTWDFAQELELPVKLFKAETELALLMELARREPPSLGHDALKKQEEINKLRFEYARRDNPDDPHRR
jgi:hypothetical protein